MNSDLSRAVQTLESGSFTCVLCSGEHLLTRSERGVKPLLELLDGDISVNGFSAADRVVGRGAAFLYILLGVRAVYAPVMSSSARQLLLSRGIEARCDKCVEVIFNRDRSGACPIENAVAKAESPDKALEIIRETLRCLSAAQ